MGQKAVDLVTISGVQRMGLVGVVAHLRDDWDGTIEAQDSGSPSAMEVGEASEAAAAAAAVPAHDRAPVVLPKACNRGGGRSGGRGINGSAPWRGLIRRLRGRRVGVRRQADHGVLQHQWIAAGGLTQGSTAPGTGGVRSEGLGAAATARGASCSQRGPDQPARVPPPAP